MKNNEESFEEYNKNIYEYLQKTEINNEKKSAKICHPTKAKLWTV